LDPVGIRPMMFGMGRFLGWVSESVRAAGWAPLSVFAFHVALMYAGAYGAVPSVDVPMHLGGGVAIAYFFARSLALAPDLVGRPSRFALGVMVVGATCAAAIGWEVAEWAWARRVSGGVAHTYHDTLLDLVLGAVGGTFYAVAAYRRAPAAAWNAEPVPVESDE